MNDKLPYPPSWIDRFTRWIDRLPGPTWLYYVIATVIFVMIHAVLNWQAGAYPAGTFNAFHVWFVIEIVFVVAFVHYLDRYSDAALERFRPALQISDDAYVDLRYQLTHLPPRRTLFISLVMGVLFAGFVAAAPPEMMSQFHFDSTPTLKVINAALFGVTWFLFGALYYHAFHQLRLISRIYAEHAQIDLLRLTPLYNFSGVTARTALGISFMNLMWTITEPDLGGLAVNLINGLPYIILALIIFAWPLWGIHRRLVIEKRRAIDRNGQHWQSITAGLHHDAEAQSLDNATKYRDFLTSLDMERSLLKKVQTWPWQPDTLRGFLSALALPIVLFLIQYVIGQMLSGGK